ncbi:mandelate racemase/muconate lactonizing enzyme [Aureococcus anophagefferens]|nr:mandelate racemase/muconate lactonizing enzyme [Aureococcus anophagefferens]
MALPDVHVAECALGESGAPAPFWGDLLAGEPPPADGYVALPRAPGWGVALNRDRVDLVRPHDRDTKRALLSAFKKVTDECKNAPEPATKGRRSESAPTIRDESVMAADRALAASLLG